MKMRKFRRNMNKGCKICGSKTDDHSVIMHYMKNDPVEQKIKSGFTDQKEYVDFIKMLVEFSDPVEL